MEVLGTVERSSSDPRRNTSKRFIETWASGDNGDKEDPCLRFVSALGRVHHGSGDREDTKRIRVSDSEGSIFNEDAAYDEETGEVSHVHPVSGGRSWAACYSGRSEQGGLNELRHLNKNEPVFRV